jgi:hypothetical protein
MLSMAERSKKRGGRAASAGGVWEELDEETRTDLERALKEVDEDPGIPAEQLLAELAASRLAAAPKRKSARR